MSTNTQNQRQAADAVRDGTILEVNASDQTVRVQTGNLQTTWLKYFTFACGGVAVHRPPSIGEFCLILSPSGVLDNGYVMCGLSTEQFPSPNTSEDVTAVRFPDGAMIEYNHKASSYKMTGVKTVLVQTGTSVEIDSPESTFTGKVTVQGLLTYQAGLSGSNGESGTTEITGNIKHKGTLTNTGTVSSNGVTLATHTHTGVLVGSDNTGVPNK